MYRVVLQVGRRQRRDEARIGRHRFADEESVELGDQTGRRFRMRGKGGNEIDAVLHAVRRRTRRNRLAAVRIHGKAEGLRGGFVLVRVVDETERTVRVCQIGRALQIPACEHACRGVDVVFRVKADTAREELHQFAAEILLRLGFRVGVAVQPDQHRRVLGDGEEDFAEVAGRERAEQIDLGVHQPGAVQRLH